MVTLDRSIHGAPLTNMDEMWVCGCVTDSGTQYFMTIKHSMTQVFCYYLPQFRYDLLTLKHSSLCLVLSTSGRCYIRHNTPALLPEQNGHIFPKNILKFCFFYRKIYFLFKISLLFIGSVQFMILMALCRTAVTPLLMHWCYFSLGLSHQYVSFVSCNMLVQIKW